MFGSKANDIIQALVRSNRAMRFGARSHGRWNMQCHDRWGRLKWAEDWHNLVVDEGLNHILDVTLLNHTTQVAQWYIGLLGASPTPLPTWTAADLVNVDFTAYNEATLPAFVGPTPPATTKSVDNTGSPATYTISTNSSTVGGAYLISTNAKITPAGILYSAGAFTTGDKNLDSGDTLTVIATFTQADDNV